MQTGLRVVHPVLDTGTIQRTVNVMGRGLQQTDKRFLMKFFNGDPIQCGQLVSFWQDGDQRVFGQGNGTEVSGAGVAETMVATLM